MLACGSAAAAQPVSLGTLEIPDDPQKLVLVRGVALSGTVEAVYEHGGATLGGVEWLSVPPPRGFMVPQQKGMRIDPAKLSPLARDHFAKLPRVARLVRGGKSLDDAIVEYVAAQESLLVQASRAYRNALPLGEAEANRRARATLDPEIAHVDSVGPRAARFSANGSIRIQFVDDVARSIEVVDAPDPTPAEQAAWLRDRAEGQLRSFRMYLDADGPVFILCTSDAVMMMGGKDATAAFDEINRMKVAKTKAERDRLRPSMVRVPQKALNDMETAGFFDDRN